MIKTTAVWRQDRSSIKTGKVEVEKNIKALFSLLLLYWWEKALEGWVLWHVLLHLYCFYFDRSFKTINCLLTPFLYIRPCLLLPKNVYWIRHSPFIVPRLIVDHVERNVIYQSQKEVAIERSLLQV